MPELQKELKNNRVMDLYSQVEMPLIKILAEMEMKGVRLDSKFLADMSSTLDQEMGELREKVYQAVGEEFKVPVEAALQVLFVNLSRDIVSVAPEMMLP